MVHIELFIFFSAKKFEESDMFSLCSALEKNTTLKALSIPGRKLTIPALVRLSEMLKTNIGLDTLSLGDYELGDEGLALLAEGIALNRGVKNLDMSYKSLSPRAGLLLSKISIANMTLVDLNLSRNSLRDEGILDFWVGISNGGLPSLKILNIGEIPLPHTYYV